MATTLGRIMIASGNPSGSRGRVRQSLHQADHVVSDHAEDAGRHRRQAGRDIQAGRGNQIAKGVERAAFARRELGAR